MTTNDLAQLMRNLRVDAGLTIPDAAKRMGVDSFTLAQWEGGMNLERLTKLLRALELAYGVVIVLKRPRT